MTAACGEAFREEDCPAHKHVEWDFSYGALKRSKDPVTSPIFKIGKQSYVLRSESGWKDSVKLILLRTGPGDSSTGRCWFGLKCRDGTYSHRIQYQKLRQDYECKSWSQAVRSIYFDAPDLQSLYLTSDGRLKFFFRMNVDRTVVGTVTCTHDSPAAPAPASGIIREEVCPTHRQVEWDVGYVEPAENVHHLTSPVFSIGDQAYLLESRYEKDGAILLRLYRLGRSVAATARYWLGMKRADGSYPLHVYGGVLDMREDLGLWTCVNEFEDKSSQNVKEVGDAFMTPDWRLRFFFRMNTESTSAETCIHGTHPNPDKVSGSVREMRCCTHTHIEWDFGLPDAHSDRPAFLASPVFEIGSQLYFLHLVLGGAISPRLSLFRLGPPEPRSFRWWAGLADCDGKYLVENHCEILDLGEDLALWTRVSSEMYFLELDGSGRKPVLYSRIFFRLKTEPGGEESCVHGIPATSASPSGSIREDRCPAHTHVEWDVSYQSPDRGRIFLASPLFKIGSRDYFFDLHLENSSRFALRLFTTGTSLSGSFRWWAGLKFRDGSYYLRNSHGKLDLKEDSEFWKRVFGALFTLSDVDIRNLRPDSCLTFFFRLNVEPTGEVTCDHVPEDLRTAESEGSLLEQECPSHKHVEWDFAYSRPPGREYSWRSHAFEVGDQTYQLHLLLHAGELALELYRLGRSSRVLPHFVRFWTGCKRGDRTYHHQLHAATLDLRQDYSLWGKTASFRLPDRSDFERTHVTSDGRLVIFLQMDRAGSTVIQGTCAHGAALRHPMGKGVVRQRENQVVEWEVAYEEPREHAHLSTSPAFQIGDQCYLLELRCELDSVFDLSLYRSGKAVGGRTRAWAGLRRVEGTYDLLTDGTELEDLKDGSDLWAKVAVLGHFCSPDLEMRHLASNGCLTFNLRLESSGYLDRLRQDFQLWLQHPEEGDRIRDLRRAEVLERLKGCGPIPTGDDGKFSIFPA